MSVIYLMTFIGGYEMWKNNIPLTSIPSSEGFEILVYGEYLNFDDL